MEMYKILFLFFLWQNRVFFFFMVCNKAFDTILQDVSVTETWEYETHNLKHCKRKYSHNNEIFKIPCSASSIRFSAKEEKNVKNIINVTYSS